MKKTQKYDFITAGVIILISLLFIFYSGKIPTEQSRIMPRVYAGILIVGAVLLVLRRLRKGEEDSYDYSGSGIVITFAAMMAAYIGATWLIGLYITTPLFLICSMRFLGMKDWKVLIPVALGMDLFIFLVFYMVFKIPIPMGMVFGG
ncbi:MAG: tripartite tricarboxylate transporter TctB family protein [Lachnospiraceae bacterium]|nr:tripartite tricarboxylate transporter TctB family protein [Lachnospiraceae bacterium]